MAAGRQVIPKSIDRGRRSSLKNREIHPGQQRQPVPDRSPALNTVDEATNTVPDAAAPKVYECNTVSWSTRRVASPQRCLAMIDRDGSEQDNSEEIRNEERLRHRDDVTGAGEIADDLRLAKSAKLKTRKKGRRLSNTVIKDLIFSISPRIAAGGRLKAPPVGVPACVGEGADAIRYSASHFAKECERATQQPTVVEPSPVTLLYPALSTDPWSASIPCSSENAVWPPPWSGTFTRLSSADGSNRMVNNRKFAADALAAQSHLLRLESTGTGHKYRAACSRQRREPAKTMSEATGSTSKRFANSEAARLNRNASKAANAEQASGLLERALLQTGEDPKNEAGFPIPTASGNDSFLRGEGGIFKIDADEDKFYLVSASDSRYQNRSRAQRMLQTNETPTAHRIDTWREKKTDIGVIMGAPRSDIKITGSTKTLSSWSPIEDHILCRPYRRCSPAGATSQSSACGYGLVAASSHEIHDTMISTRALNADVGSSLHLKGQPADNITTSFTRENAYLRRTSLRAKSHTVLYRPSHSKELPQMRSETNHFRTVTAGLDPSTVLCEVPKNKVRSSHGGLQQLVLRVHEMQARQTPSQAVKGVEFTTLCKPSHSGKPSYGLYNLPRIMTAATTRGSTTVLDRIAYKKDAASHGIQSFHDGLKPDVPLCVRVSASRDVGARRGSLCEQPTRDGAWRPVPRPRTIHISKKERNTTEDQMSRVAVSCPRKLPEEGAEGEPVNTRSEQPKNECANPSKDRVKHKTAPNKTPAATGERKGVEGIAEEHCSLAQQATRASETTVLKTPIVENNADSIEADKIDVYSMLLEIKCDSSATYDVPTLLSASLTKEAEKTEIFYNENHCDESAAIIARKDELVFRETALNHYLDVSEREHAGSEAVKPVCNYELLGGKAVELNGVCASVVEDSPLPYATSRIAGKPDRLLYTEIVVATVVSLTCLVWIAAVFPVRRLELTRILHIKTGNATEPSFIALTFQTFWYSTVSEITTTSTSKASSRSYYCSSHFCLKEAAYVKSVIGKDASPCDNFYEYACSKWESKTPLSAMGLGVSTSVDTVIDEYMSSDLRDYILQKKNGGANSARFLYKACMSSYRHTSAFLKAKIFSALPVKTWPFNGTIDPLEIWRTAGIMARKYGVPALLNVVAGIERATNNSIVEVTLPRPLFFNGDESRPNVKHMFRNAIREAATEFNYTTMAANLTAQIMEVFKGIAMVSDQPAASRTCRVRKLKHIDHSVRTFITSVFNGDINPNTTVVVGNSDVVLGGLVRLTHNLSAQDFLNYLGFRLLVRLAVLLPEHLVNIRRLFSVEFTGRVVRDDLKWLLCMRLAVAVAPACLENLQAKMFAETRAPTLARWFWLLQVEDFFSRNLRLCAWISEKTLSLMEKKMERYKFVHVSFDKASENSAGCDNVRKLLASRRRLRKSQLVPAILATWETYQERYLSQTSQRLLPRDPGFLFEVHPRLAESLQTVYVPAGLVNASVPENSTMLAFHLSRVATRLFRALVPLASAEGGQCSVPSALTQQSQRSLVRLRKCLDKDAQSLPSQLQPRASDVLWDGEGREGDEAGFAILAQTAALGLAFAAFKDMLRVDLIWRLNFRFASLANVSADQLFFLYYALDNCELSDRTHRAHEYGAWRRLPAEQRVNLPLRQMAHFAEAFGCEPGRSAMAPMNRCGVLRWPAPRPGLWNDGR